MTGRVGHGLPRRRAGRLETARRAAPYGVVIGAALFVAATYLAIEPVPATLGPGASQTAPVTDRSGRPLSASYAGERWNVHDPLRLDAIPQFLREAIVLAEDARFWQHEGVDWRARLAAVKQNVLAGEKVRGASTIPEQVVRLLHPRPRTVWSRWLEGFEATALVERFGRPAVLEFYLNQAPYGDNRRGVAQAARHYFGREPETLSRHEMLALAVLLRAPSALDPRRHLDALERRVQWLAGLARERGLLDETSRVAILDQGLQPASFDRPEIGAGHFLRVVRHRHQMSARPELVEGHLAGPSTGSGRADRSSIRSTLDAALQAEVQNLLDQRVQDLARRGVQDGAVLVVDLEGRKVRAWAVAGESGIDAVLAPRQPGSTLKPLLYGLALERGWTAATAIEDTDLAEQVGGGLHRYRNYSGQHYGWVTLREALGNSLNIPALRALQFVGGDAFLGRLQALGVQSLDRHPEVYGDGLALGNGELSLYELVQAYAVLADRGRFRRLAVLESGPEAPVTQVMPADVASLVTDILADDHSRLLEFGDGGALRYPVQTAVKTGTSSDYRDAWTVAYNQRYVVGAWIGNLSARPMEDVTGSVGPALLVRSVFAALNRTTPAEPLWRDPALVAREVCAPGAASGCARYREWFRPGTAPAVSTQTPAPLEPRFVQPFDGLQLALDPRVPDDHEKLEFRFAWAGTPRQVVWRVDGRERARTENPRWLWPLEKGWHVAQAEVTGAEGKVLTTRPVRFEVR